MPIFEYKCNDCGQVTEFLEKKKGPQKHICKNCNGSNLQKLLSGFAVGQSKSSNQACESCPGGPCSTSPCAGGFCPHS